MEEDLKRADKLAAIGTLAAGMAHEIRNPLASISGSIEILKEEMENSFQHQQLMDIILREVGRLNSLIADFLLFARPASPGKELIHLNGIVEEILAVFSHSPDCRPGIRLVTKFHDDLSMRGEVQQIKQVFWNLFINAAEAMSDGGELRVELSRRPPWEFPESPYRVKFRSATPGRELEKLKSAGSSILSLLPRERVRDWASPSCIKSWKVIRGK
jgi:two-component system sensor histidine kinase PilS (NtrC family)